MIADQTRRIHSAAPARIQIFLSENQLYRAIIVAESARMKIVQKSGIHSNTRNTIALILANCTRVACLVVKASLLDLLPCYIFLQLKAQRLKAEIRLLKSALSR